MDLLKTAPWEKPYRFRSYGLQKILGDDDELPDLTQTAPYAKTDSPYGSLYAPTAYTARQNTDTPTKPPESEPTPKTKEAEAPQFSFGTAVKNFGQAALNGFNNTFYGIGSALEDFFIAPIVEFGGDIAQATAIAAGADPQGEWGKTAADATRLMNKGKEYTERNQAAVSQEAEENIGRIENDTLRSVAEFAQNEVAPSTLTAAVSAMAAPYVAAASAVPSTQSLTQAAHLAQNPTLVNKVTSWLSKQFGSPNYWISFGQEYVGEYDRAIADGETPEKAALVAANTATLNALVENSGGYQTLPDDVGDIASRSGKQGLRKWVKAILDEGYEEVVQDIISRTVEKIGYHSETPLFSTTDGKAIINPSRLLQDFLGGAAVASIIAGGETAVDNAVNGAQVSNILPQTDAETTAASTQTVANAESSVYNEAAAPENLMPQQQIAEKQHSASETATKTKADTVTNASSYAFSALSQTVESLQTTAAQRTQMQQSVSALQTEYDHLQANWATMTPWERERAAEDIKLLTNSLQRELANGYFGGQQTEVNQARGTLELIDTLTDNLVRGLPEGTAQPSGELLQTITDGLTAGLENAGEVGYNQNTVAQGAFESDQAMFETYQDVLGENAPATFEEFEALKNGDPEAFAELTDFYDYKCLVPEATKENFFVYKAVCDTGIYGIVRVPPKQIDTSLFTIETDHINDRGHNVSLNEATSYIDNAMFTIERTMGTGPYAKTFINYYSSDGATYVNVGAKTIRTAFKCSEFNTKTVAAVEAAKNAR